MGMLAEELYDVVPEVVTLDEHGAPSGIAYGQMVPLLIKAIQELQAEIRSIRNGN